jgi:hypothetical protein
MMHVVMLNVIMLNVIMLSVVMLSLVMLSLVMLGVIMLNVVALEFKGSTTLLLLLQTFSSQENSMFSLWHPRPGSNPQT